MFGQVIGRHDERFIGHAWCCPARLYASLRTAQGIEDQWVALCLWVGLPGVQDVPGADDAWARMSWSLMQRAEQLGVPFPVCDDASELTGVS